MRFKVLPRERITLLPVRDKNGYIQKGSVPASLGSGNENAVGAIQLKSRIIKMFTDHASGKNPLVIEQLMLAVYKENPSRLLDLVKTVLPKDVDITVQQKPTAPILFKLPSKEDDVYQPQNNQSNQVQGLEYDPWEDAGYAGLQGMMGNADNMRKAQESSPNRARRIQRESSGGRKKSGYFSEILDSTFADKIAKIN